jgi:hypothetical protein
MTLEEEHKCVGIKSINGIVSLPLSSSICNWQNIFQQGVHIFRKLFSTKNTVTLWKVWIKTASSSEAYELWNINSIRRNGLHITIKVWKIYNGKIEVVSFIIKPDRKLTIGVKLEVNIKKWGRGNCFCSSFISSSSRVY